MLRLRHLVLGIAVSALGCRKAPTELHERVPADVVDTGASPSDSGTRDLDAATEDASIDASDASRSPQERADVAALRHFDTKEGIALLLPSLGDAGPSLPLYHFRYEPGFFNQGRKLPFPLEGTTDRPQHAIDKAACMKGLAGIEIQTASQRARCKGEANMVPIYRGGREEEAKACIDVFEYPNVACEYPLVWGNPANAQRICAASGKRLCTQPEWNLACAGDPQGGKDQRYAYGDEPDLEICNTNKPHPMRPGTALWICNATNAKSAWETCATETEPSGAFPRCRSRFGVYDLAGNVAEMMTRRDGEATVTQLKGSAFFYVDVFRRHDDPSPRKNGRETYPDHCTFDPRWHVEDLQTALHSNYHLGFRCCKDL